MNPTKPTPTRPPDRPRPAPDRELRTLRWLVASIRERPLRDERRQGTAA